MKRHGRISPRYLYPVPLPLLSPHHSTAPPSLRRYESRYEDRFLSQTEPTYRRFTYQDAKRCMLVSVAACSTVLRCSHEYRSRLHQRDKVPSRTHASELPRCFVEDGAATLEGGAGRVVGHEKHFSPTQGGP